MDSIKFAILMCLDRNIQSTAFMVACFSNYGTIEGLVSEERWSYSRGDSCMVECAMGEVQGIRIVSFGRWLVCSRGALCMMNVMNTFRG